MIHDLDRIAAEQSKEVSKQLIRAAAQGGTEADFRREAARIFGDAAQCAALTIVPRDEFSVARGRVDSVYNRFVLEYKRPGVIRATNTGKSNQAVIQQVKDYIGDVATRERREVHRLAGVATDGNYFLFVRRVGEGWSVDEPVAVNAASTERFLRLLFSLCQGAALVPENLVNDFGPKHDRARRAVRAIYRGLSSSKQPLVGKLFEQWRTFFAEATDYREWSERLKSKPEFESFVKSLWTKEEIKHLEPASVFFVLHTYYALLIKLVASMAAARFVEGSSTSLSSMASLEGEDLREQLRELEDGGLFRHYGIRNFLEGDFFGWYLSGWNHDIEDGVRDIVKRLAEYDPGTIELAPENARDLLKKLYHYLLPREIRHDLGEYYTPDWLAERLIRQTMGTRDLGDPTKRVLDPACGSGTFLVLLINHARRGALQRKLGPQKTLDLIRQNIVGFDLNPLAVIAARTNYLLALGNLVREAKSINPEGIDIPIYQCDSIVLPEPSGDLLEQGYPLPTSVGTFRIPIKFATRDRMESLANLLDECVDSQSSEHTFISRLSDAADVYAQEMDENEAALLAIYRRLRELHDHGLNGVWARIIKNGFAPLFIGEFEYIVGNPPWVNWENLPDEYRDRSKSLWMRYGLFPKRAKGMDTILGAAKYDLSTLMTCVSLDRYLQADGRLGFVLPQGIFKTSGAGQGFRRFELPDGTPFAPLIVEDMVDLKPFEGASNRTCVALFRKGQRTKYPVPYQVWRKRQAGRAGSFGFDTPYEEVTSNRITYKVFNASPVDKSDSTSAWQTGPPSAAKSFSKLEGASEYVARKGVTASVNGVFWLRTVGKRSRGIVIAGNVTERSKKPVRSTQASFESELLYPLVRGSDVGRWSVKTELHILLTHLPGQRLKAIPEGEMQTAFPKTWGYLNTFTSQLRASGIYKRYFKSSDPFYSIFNVGDYTFSPFKLLIREISSDLTCAVVGSFEGKPCVPDHKLILVPFDDELEAHYLCAVSNSLPARVFVKAYTLSTSFSTHVFNHLSVQKFDRRNALHLRLAEASKQAHATMETGARDVPRIEEDIARMAARLWGLSEKELSELARWQEET